jgi:hypothetical protein
MDHHADHSNFGQHIGSLTGKNNSHPVLDTVKNHAQHSGDSKPNINLPVGKGKGKGK